MVKKLFALASVTALTGLMVSVAGAGCSSTTVDPGPATDAATNPETSKKAPTEASVGDNEEPAPSTECKGVTEVDTSNFPWKSPAKTVGACTSKDLDGLVTYLKANKEAKYADWKTAIKDPTCVSCVFGKDTDAAWKPLAENEKGQLSVLNVGGCIAIASGNDKCGQAYQAWFDCGFEACNDCPADDSDAFSKCRTAAIGAKGGCKKAGAAILTACGGEKQTADAEAACEGSPQGYVFEGPIKAQCIGLTADGGDQ